MNKGKIISISNYGNVDRYVIKKQKDVHVLLCNLFSELKFSENTISQVDMVFDDIDNEYIYIDESKKSIEIHMFITTDSINLVIKTTMSQKKLNQLLAKFFEFP
ncbi:MAG: hypothetical protein Q8O03_09000 [Nanoarchaeota archaeon]|nr:hypothetical protein [Nanoarchaeota archaeon]